jgi:dihydroflavonol-4-reductase
MDLLKHKILVTGANGHLGTNLVLLLSRRNCNVRLFLRPQARLRIPLPDHMEIIHGDVCNVDQVKEATQGVSLVFHLASPTTLTPDLPEAIQKSTQNILSACDCNHVQRLVYVSSAVVGGFSSTPNQMLREDDNLFVPASAYHVWKYWAEKQVRAFIGKTDTQVVIVRPTTVIGGYDFKTTPSSMPVLVGRKRALRFWFESGITVAPVVKVAQGLLQAMEQGQSGATYILGGESVSIKQYFSLINQLNHRKGPYLRISNSLMYLAGLGFSVLQSLGFSRVPFDLKRAQSLIGKYGYYSSQKAVSEIAYEIGTAAEAIQDYYFWLSHNEQGAPHHVDPG